MPLREDLYYLPFPREGDMLHHVGPHGEAPGSLRRQKGAKGKLRPQLWLCFPHKSGQGRGNSLALPALSYVSGLWALGWSLVVWYLVLGDSGQEKYWLDMAGDMGSGLQGSCQQLWLLVCPCNEWMPDRQTQSLRKHS